MEGSGFLPMTKFKGDVGLIHSAGDRGTSNVRADTLRRGVFCSVPETEPAIQYVLAAYCVPSSTHSRYLQRSPGTQGFAMPLPQKFPSRLVPGIRQDVLLVYGRKAFRVAHPIAHVYREPAFLRYFQRHYYRGYLPGWMKFILDGHIPIDQYLHHFHSIPQDTDDVSTGLLLCTLPPYSESIGCPSRSRTYVP